MQRLTRLHILALALVVFPVFAGETTTGEVQKIETKKNELVVSAECECGSGKIIQMTFTVKDSTKVLLDGREAKLADIKQGDRVEIEYEQFDDVEKVSATRNG
jgi:Cu/Ag efflux protein CusF